MLACDLQPLLLIVLAERGFPRFRVFGLLFATELALELAELVEMEREWLLVLKHSSIADHGSLLQPHIHSHDWRRSRRQRFLDLHLNAQIPVTGLTRHGRAQNRDCLTEKLFAAS